MARCPLPPPPCYNGGGGQCLPCGETGNGWQCQGNLHMDAGGGERIGLAAPKLLRNCSETALKLI